MQERIPDELTLPELTLRGLILGALITVVFTASNVYLGLKVGLTFASSIPAAVISMAVLRYFSGANILENNMVQTQASAAGTLSSIIFILPGLLMIGYWSGFPFWQTAAICSIGVAALWTLATLFKPMVRGVWASLGAVRGNSQANSLRTELDMPAKWILLIAGILLVSLFVVFSHFLGAAAPDMASPQFWSLVAVCVVFAFFFGFLIAAACGYMAGLVGSSSSPISGIGIIAVILVSLLILGFGSIEGGLLDRQNGKLAIALALFTTSVVLAIAAISNDNLQDLKTGYLVGATPWRQQVALIVGCIVGALVIPPVLELLYSAYGFTGALPREGMDPGQALAAPQATLMTAIASGIFHDALNWNMILIGVALGIALILVDLLLRRTGKACLPVLAVGLGIYLPPTIGMTLVVGALISWLLENALKKRAAAAGVDEEAYAEEPKRRGVLLASGLIVGESLMGILLAGVIGATGEDAPLALAGAGFAGIAQWLGLVVFVAICVLFYRRVLAR